MADRPCRPRSPGRGHRPTLLDAGGALAGHAITDRNPAAAPTASVAAARLLASTVERLACWAADHTAIDLAYSAPPRPPEHEHPVRIVQVPGDLAAGQRQLEAFLTPMATRNLHSPYRLSADTANVVALNQTMLLVDLHQGSSVNKCFISFSGGR
jgi:hypothetical protein